MRCVEIFLVSVSFFLFLITFPFSLCVCLKIVSEYERAVIFRLGKLRAGEARGPGLFFILPCVDEYINVDLRTTHFDIPPQETLTKDSVTVWVDAVVYYKVVQPLRAVVAVVNYSTSTSLLAMTTLRNIIGTRSLAEVLADRDIIAQRIAAILDQATDPWGVKVERVEITDVRLPQQLQKAMAAEAEATREARAKIIAAEGELKASKALKEAADVIVGSPTALQLRYLQTLTNISGERTSTIVFPVPIEMLRAFMDSRRIRASSHFSSRKTPIWRS
ncbi:stomatin-like isoform X2 [Zophobas morio]|uniref:stomatin-like isoform X2 n=1 Tax=Zophobas morio TaxID=2755281 RepID=UPI0030828B37